MGDLVKVYRDYDIYVHTFWFTVVVDFAYIKPPIISFDIFDAIQPKFINKIYRVYKFGLTDAGLQKHYNGDQKAFIVDMLLKNMADEDEFVRNNIIGYVQNMTEFDIPEKNKKASNSNVSYRHPVINKLPGLQEMVKHPVNGCIDTLERVIIALNDYEKWTVNQIADWLDTLDIDLRIKL